MLTWIQKALPQFKDFEGEALSYVENWTLCKSAEWLPDLSIIIFILFPIICIKTHDLFLTII